MTQPIIRNAKPVTKPDHEESKHATQEEGEEAKEAVDNLFSRGSTAEHGSTPDTPTGDE